MRRCLGLLLAVALLAAAMTPAAQESTVAPRRLALLVGVTEFTEPSMKKFNLHGPENDTDLLRTILTSDRFSIPPANIVTLAGLPADASRQPTRANIEREFRRLRDQSGPGDQVLIFLAGHGSQQPADPDPNDDEPDGLDEIFLPADTQGWDSSTRLVINSISDDDLRQWIRAIRNTGAAVTVIVDACHSGTITRGGPDQPRDRGIPVEDLIPPSALSTARAAARATTRSLTRPGFDLVDAPGDIAALYAADMTETTPELLMPDRDGRMHGLFTYTLARVLAERTGPISYRELVKRVTDRYRAGGFRPTPSLEGSGVDREVLGDRSALPRSTFAIDTDRQATRWKIGGGSIHGIARGSILEILPAGRADPVGYVRVTEVGPTTAVATPVAFANLPAPRAAQVVADSRARVKRYEFGSLHLTVALQRTTTAGAMAIVPVGAGPRAVEQALAVLPARSDGLAQRVTTTNADLFLRVIDNRLALIPAGDRDLSRRFDVGSPTDPHLADLLAERLKRVARARNLSKLASYVDPDADLQVGVARYIANAPTSAPFPAADGDAGINAGDRLKFTIRNTGTVPLDVTVLYVDANYGITPLFPATDAAIDNRLAPGAERALDSVEITADPVGWESVVAIGVEATPRHENFLTLAQESLTETRGGPASPLRLLLESAVYGTRGIAPKPDDDRGRFAITQTWFRVQVAGK